MKVLQGIRVVDLSRVLAGPHCAQLLADFGADVIKVEGPGGDENRGWPPHGPDGQSANFASVNRGKRSLVLDLKTPAARDILLRLAADADVLIHSFLPDTAARLGISLERLRRDNPRLVVATISGYGAAGPLADKRGYDLMVQAFAGAMSTTGVAGGSPIRCGVSFIDMSTGISLYAGIVTALLARTTTGQGNWVRGSLLETAVALLGYHAVAWMQAGVLPVPQGSGSGHLVPYQAFRCSDGYMLAGAPNDGAWKRFCDALEWPDLSADPRFHGNVARVEMRDVLVSMLEGSFQPAPRRILGGTIRGTERGMFAAAHGGSGDDASTGGGQCDAGDRTGCGRRGPGSGRHAVQTSRGRWRGGNIGAAVGSGYRQGAGGPAGVVGN